MLIRTVLVLIGENKCFTHGSNFTCVSTNKNFFFIIRFFIQSYAHIIVRNTSFEWNGLVSNDYDEKL